MAPVSNRDRVLDGYSLVARGNERKEKLTWETKTMPGALSMVSTAGGSLIRSGHGGYEPETKELGLVGAQEVDGCSFTTAKG